MGKIEQLLRVMADMEEFTKEKQNAVDEIFEEDLDSVAAAAWQPLSQYGACNEKKDQP